MAEDIRLELKAMPTLQRYVDLLTQPGYLAITLENNDLSPSQSSKIKVGENGGSAEIRNAVVRFTGRKGTLFSYEAAYLLGLGDTKVSFPVYVDTSALRVGKVTVTLMECRSRAISSRRYYWTLITGVEGLWPRAVATSAMPSPCPTSGF